MLPWIINGCALAATVITTHAAVSVPAPQKFTQEVARQFGPETGAPQARVQLLEPGRSGWVRVFAEGQWIEYDGEKWNANPALKAADEQSFEFPVDQGGKRTAAIPWREVRQLLRAGTTTWVVGVSRCLRLPAGADAESIPYPPGVTPVQVAIAPDNVLYLASSAGLFERGESTWRAVLAGDSSGRIWTVGEVLGVAVDTKGQLWFATRSGVGCRTASGWRFYEGRDGLPWNDFTGIWAGREGEVWFGTRLGAIRWDGQRWHYRQGKRWLPDDTVLQAVVDERGDAWFGTAGGVGWIGRRAMTLAEKAEYYETEIERYIKRTPFGYVAEAPLRQRADKRTANPQDSDNDGLWTAMYGAGQAFAYGATKDPQAGRRARQAFEALRFLQRVTQGCDHAPPRGYFARTIRPVEWPDPNVGRLEEDRERAKGDKLWKVYEPRWPRSADGKWFWKSDTSSDELDGHYFFYPLYYDLCAETAEERERVKEVVRDITDHLIEHRFTLIDHDGKPTRWGIYGPQDLNRDPWWWQERGLKSLSILSYLAVAEHVVGDPRYGAAARELVEREGYAQNLMHPKVQHGPGSGNQSDDEMAVMCFYTLLRYSKDEVLKGLARISFYRYWLNEEPEMNPFFNFAYAACNLGAEGGSPFGRFSLTPWENWRDDSMTTLCGFPLDRLNWGHHNSHRLDLVALPPVQSVDVEEPERRPVRGHLVTGKVIPVENRHFNHWNTDPWRLDYGGDGNELAAGTVFLLPYYMGLYHGYIQKPTP